MTIQIDNFLYEICICVARAFELAEAWFAYFTTIDGVQVFRKRK